MNRIARNRETPWTVLVYLAGDNELSSEMVWSLQEMRRSIASVRGSIHLTAEIDPAGGSPRRYELTNGKSTGDGDLVEVGAPAPRVEDGESAVERFLTDGVEALRPSARTAVFLSGHGSGAVGDLLTDSEPKSALSVPTLRAILARVRERIATRRGRRAKLDLLGLDSCQMSSVELAYAARESVRYLVASEGTVLDTGWPYATVVQSFAQGGNVNVRAVGRAIAEAYLRFYRDYEIGSHSTDVAVSDLAKVGDVAAAVAELAKALREPLERLLSDGLEEAVELGALRRPARTRGVESARDVRDALVLAHWSAQSYKCDRYVDLYDFAAQLCRYCSRRRGSEPKRLRTIGEKLMRAIERTVVASGTTGPELQHSHGLSIYFPWSSRDLAPEYRDLDFARDTGWAEFLEVYVQATRRMRRGEARRRGEQPSGSSAARSPGLAAGARDPDAGTHRDPDAGTHRGKSCISTMRNPPDGFYRKTR